MGDLNASVRSNTRRRAVLRAAAASLAGVLPRTGRSQSASDYPNRPVRFIVPFPPGSGTDTSARGYGRKLTELTGQPVVVENRPGGNGFIGIQAVKSAPADGHTVFIGTNSTLATNVALFRKLPYDPVADFEPVSGLLRAPALLIVPPGSPYRTLAEYVAAARSEPGRIAYGAGSAGYRLMGELFSERAGVQLNPVAFKGAGDAVQAVAGGQIDSAIVETTSAATLVRSGKLRALGIAATERSPVLPDVPTVSEAGVQGYVIHAWAAAVVLAGTPKPIVERLGELLQRIATMPETRESFAAMNGEVLTLGPSELRRFQLEEIERWKRIATTAKVELQ